MQVFVLGVLDLSTAFEDGLVGFSIPILAEYAGGPVAPLVKLDLHPVVV